MKIVDDLILRIKRGDSAATSVLRDVYRWLLRYNIPDTPLLRRAYAALYYAHDAGLGVGELTAAKLLWEPMVRARFHHVGKRVHVSGLPYVLGHARISIGDGCNISKFTVSSGRFVDEPELTIGKRCTIGYGTSFSVNQLVWLGDHVSIAGHCFIADSDGHPVELERRVQEQHLTAADIRPVRIEDHVWLGRNAHVLKGVTVGRGAVVASGSVVTSDVPPGALAMGVPARMIKSL
jgi:acetyltransferase-like isoleucine patch superfamily enzyme